MPRSPIHRSTPLQPGGATPELESKPLNYKLIAGADLQLLRLTHAHSRIHICAYVNVNTNMNVTVNAYDMLLDLTNR